MFTKTVIQNNGTCICERKEGRLIGDNAVRLKPEGTYKATGGS